MADQTACDRLIADIRKALQDHAALDRRATVLHNNEKLVETFERLVALAGFSKPTR